MERRGQGSSPGPSLGKDVGTPTCPLPPPTDTGVTHCLRPPLSGRQPLTPQLERLAARSVEAPQHFAALWSEASGAACAGGRAGGRAVGHLVGRSQEVTSGVGPCGMGIGARGHRDAPAAAVAPGSSAGCRIPQSPVVFGALLSWRGSGDRLLLLFAVGSAASWDRAIRQLLVTFLNLSSCLFADPGATLRCSLTRESNLSETDHGPSAEGSAPSGGKGVSGERGATPAR